MITSVIGFLRGEVVVFTTGKKNRPGGRFLITALKIDGTYLKAIFYVLTLKADPSCLRKKATKLGEEELQLLLSPQIFSQ